jgi:hypothetical protein
VGLGLPGRCCVCGVLGSWFSFFSFWVGGWGSPVPVVSVASVAFRFRSCPFCCRPGYGSRRGPLSSGFQGLAQQWRVARRSACWSFCFLSGRVGFGFVSAFSLEKKKNASLSPVISGLLVLGPALRCFRCSPAFVGELVPASLARLFGFLLVRSLPVSAFPLCRGGPCAWALWVSDRGGWACLLLCLLSR